MGQQAMQRTNRAERAPLTQPRNLLWSLWSGRVISAFVLVFLLVDGAMKALRLDPAVNGTVDLGYPSHQIHWIGLILLVCTALWTIPRTGLIGAVLLTGYLGGATAAQLRVEQSFVFPVVLGLLVWAGLLLRDTQTRRFLIQSFQRTA
jgi:hypothetical protein